MISFLKKNKVQLIAWPFIIAVLYFMTMLNVSMTFRNIFLVVATSLCVGLAWEENSEHKIEIFILLLGLTGRIVFCYLDVFTEFQLPIGGSDDGIAFWANALRYYNGDFSKFYTTYPYILNAIFQIAGVNQFAAQYVNILCWCFASIIMQKICKCLDITGIFRTVSVVLLAWLPTNIWITSILYRDVYVMLFLIISFYYLLIWMQGERQYGMVLSVLAVFVATLLHGASIMAILPVMFAFVFYSQKQKKFCISKKSIVLLIACGSMLTIIFLVPFTREIVLKKIPSMDGGLIEGLNRYLENKYDGSTAGSDYLTGRYLTGYFDIIVMTVQRIYYHTFSPTPDMWRGITDVVAFFMSTAPIYLAGLGLWFASLFYKKADAYRLVLFLEVFITIGVYAWGNKNAGQALRHREKIIGHVILLAIYSLNIIIQKRKEQKNYEKITEI